MAMFHFHASVTTRAKGQSAVAAAAYRAGVRLLDMRTGKVFDFSRRRGILAVDLVLPTGCTWQPTL
jgi:hypothetical protein